MKRLRRKSAKPGRGAGLRCGSVICAIVKPMPDPVHTAPRRRSPAAIRGLQWKYNPARVGRKGFGDHVVLSDPDSIEDRASELFDDAADDARRTGHGDRGR